MSIETGLRLPLKALAALLGYPDAALQAHAEELAAILASREELSEQERGTARRFAEWLARSDLMEVQSCYVETFDRSRKSSLYLFEHVYGESRDRGPAMIELKKAYHEHGLFICRRELPDFLPLFLEFTAELHEPQAREWICNVGHILQRVHVRLVEKESPYAAVFRVLLEVARLDPAPEALSRFAAGEARADTPAALDAAWMEEPVLFGPEDAPACGAGKPQSMENRRTGT